MIFSPLFSMLLLHQVPHTHSHDTRREGSMALSSSGDQEARESSEGARTDFPGSKRGEWTWRQGREKQTQKCRINAYGLCDMFPGFCLLKALYSLQRQ